MRYLNKASAVLLIATGLAQAAVIYNNGGPNLVNGYGIFGSSWTADDFVIAGGGTVTSVGFYFQNFNGITDWNQDLTYNIIADSGGPSGAVLATGAAQNLVAVDSGLPWCCPGGNAYLVTFDLVSFFAASAGTTYWLQLTGATGGSAAWWVTADANATPPGYSNLFDATGQQFAFYLTDDLADPVPEPTSLALFGSAAVALFALRARKS